MALIRRKFTVADYHTMIKVGILHEDERVELIRGNMICMSPKGSKHSACISRIQEALVSLGKEILTRYQEPITLSDHSEPEPDVALVKRQPDYYVAAHPGPSDIFLLIEVADSSLQFDRAIKLPLYAAEGITECWIVNVCDQQLEVYRDPSGNKYQSREIFLPGDYIPVPGSSEIIAVGGIVG
ncbi:MAG: Uma2 family endonuclease [Bacteroidota bacterium]